MRPGLTRSRGSLRPREEDWAGPRVGLCSVSTRNCCSHSCRDRTVVALPSPPEQPGEGWRQKAPAGGHLSVILKCTDQPRSPNPL